MQGGPVDERDSLWEDDAPRFRLYTFRGAGNAVTTLDLWDCSVEEALDAGEQAGVDGCLWSLALVHGTGSQRGLVWLSGYDYNDTARTPQQWRMRRQMQDRYLAARARAGEPVTLPNGLRVIRMFPGWADSPLWASFTDSYVADPAALGLSPDLVADLHAWNEAWNSHPETAPMPDEQGFLAEGRRLHARVQGELAGIAEVRPEFDR